MDQAGTHRPNLQNAGWYTSPAHDGCKTDICCSLKHTVPEGSIRADEFARPAGPINFGSLGDGQLCERVCVLKRNQGIVPSNRSAPFDPACGHFELGEGSEGYELPVARDVGDVFGHSAKHPSGRKCLQGCLVAPNPAGEKFPHGSVLRLFNRTDQCCVRAITSSTDPRIPAIARCSGSGGRLRGKCKKSSSPTDFD